MGCLVSKLLFLVDPEDKTFDGDGGKGGGLFRWLPRHCTCPRNRASVTILKRDVRESQKPAETSERLN